MAGHTSDVCYFDGWEASLDEGKTIYLLDKRCTIYLYSSFMIILKDLFGNLCIKYRLTEIRLNPHSFLFVVKQHFNFAKDLV
jgi:hypothetical protein